MKKLSVPTMAKKVKMKTIKHSPALLTGIGIAGMIGSAVMAVKATPKALELLEDKKGELDKEELTPMETVKATYKPYIPAVVTGVASIACLIGGTTVSAKRNAALTAAYELSRTAMNEYKEKVIETIGEKKESQVRDAVAAERVKKQPVEEHKIILTEEGSQLCYDMISGRYFKSDMDKLRRAENELNKRLMSEMYISLNEFYYEIGLPSVKIGNELGWNVDDGLINLTFSSQLTDEDKVCVVVDYCVGPRYDYRNLK